MSDTLEQRHVITVDNDPKNPDALVIFPEVYGSYESAAATARNLKIVVPECTFKIYPANDPFIERWYPVLHQCAPARKKITPTATVAELAAKLPSRPVKILRSQTEVACTRNGKPSYRWAPAWKIVCKFTERDIIQPYSRKRSEAISTAQKAGYSIKHIDSYFAHAR